MKKFEFSKIICVTVISVSVTMITFACYMIWKTEDLSPLETLIASIATIASTCVAFYFNKAKTENKLKLMKKYGVKPTEETFEGGSDYNE